MMKPMPIARRSVFAAIAVAVALSLLAGCSDASKLDTSRAARKIPVELGQKYPTAVIKNTKCTPNKVKLAAGVPFNCKAEIQGQVVHIAVVEDDQKGNVSFTLDKALVDVDKQSQDLVATLAKTNDPSTGTPTAATAADCPGPRVRVMDVDQTFTCSVTIAGVASPYSVIVCDIPARFVYISGATVDDPAGQCKSSASGGSGPSGSSGPSGASGASGPSGTPGGSGGSGQPALPGE